MNKYINTFIITLLIMVCFLPIPAFAQVSAEQSQVYQGNAAVDPANPDWSAMDVLGPETAGQIALAGNPTVEAAQARIGQAEERIAQARSAYWPRLDASAGASRLWWSENDYLENQAYLNLFYPNAVLDDPYDTYQTDLTASWLVFNGFARSLNKKAAEYGRDQAAYAREDVKRYLLLSVTSAYLSAQLAQENIAITRTDEQFYRDRWEEAKVRRRVGTGTLGDELNFEVRFNAAIADRIRAERVYEAALYSLAALLGLEDASLPGHVSLMALGTESPDEMQHPNAEEWIAYAYEHRPDILRQNVAVKSSEVDIKRAKSGFYPTISLYGTIAGDGSDDTRFEEDDFGSAVGVQLTYNLFAGGFDRARTREAGQREKETRKTLEQARLDAAQGVRSAIANLRGSQEQLLLLRTNEELIRRNRDLAEKEYNAGVGSLVRLNEAQRDLTTAQNRLALAIAGMRQSWYTLEAETGHILMKVVPN